MTKRLGTWVAVAMLTGVAAASMLLALLIGMRHVMRAYGL